MFSLDQDHRQEEDNKKGNVYVFIWNTPIYIYKVTMRLPQIEVRFSNVSTVITQKVDYKLMIVLIQNNFVNWSFYIVHYLFSFMKFRTLIQRFLSKQKRSFASNKIVSSDNIVDYIDSKNISKEYMYINTDDKGCNSINVIRSYSMIYYSDKGKNFNFSFNLNQMKILSFISQFECLSSFLLKLIIQTTNPLTVKLNYDFFNTFDKNFYLNQLTSRNIKRKNIFEGITIYNPYLEKITIINNDIESDTNDNKRYELLLEGIRDLCDIPSKETWATYITSKGESILDKKEFSFFGEKFKTGSVKCNNVHRKSVIEDASPMNNSKMFCLRRRNKLNTNVNCNDRLLKYNILKRSHNHINRVLH